jgi:hypothetical protein
MLPTLTVILQGSSAAIHLKTSAHQSAKQLKDKQPPRRPGQGDNVCYTEVSQREFK